MLLWEKLIALMGECHAILWRNLPHFSSLADFLSRTIDIKGTINIFNCVAMTQLQDQTQCKHIQQWYLISSKITINQTSLLILIILTLFVFLLHSLKYSGHDVPGQVRTLDINPAYPKQVKYRCVCVLQTQMLPLPLGNKTW